MRSKDRIIASRKHLALSAPTHTTQDRQSGGTDFDLALAAAVLTDAAARAGAAIMRLYHEGAKVRLKEDASPVTEADKASEAIVIDALQRLAPDIPIVSEEIAGDRSADLGPSFFLVDPLDGTKEFIQKRSDFTVNIALVEDGAPRFGLVYAPARSLLATTPSPGKAIEVTVEPSERGADLAALDCRTLHVRAPSPDGLVAVVSRSHLDPATESFLAKLKIAGRSDAGSALKFLEVARGVADVYPRFGPTMEWDTAAGHAILNAAGGHVEDAEGKPLRYGKTAAGLRNPGFVAWGQSAAGA
jgi:3'(2'), 5'-bisphosphate nucleotidase